VVYFKVLFQNLARGAELYKKELPPGLVIEPRTCRLRSGSVNRFAAAFIPRQLAVALMLISSLTQAPPN
jgi:hypothetical protein